MSYQQVYSTGQVSGITSTSFMSLYRYVKMFPEFFTPEVTKHTRGRRWSEQDLIVLLSIKSLFDRRFGEKIIREKLQGGWRIDQNPATNQEVLESFELIFETCLRYQDEAKRDREAAHNLTLNLGQLYKHSKDDHQIIQNLIKAVNNHSQEIAELYTRKTSFISFGPKPDTRL